MEYVPYRTPEQWKQYFQDQSEGISDDQKVQIDILGMIKNTSGPDSTLAALLQADSGTPSVFKGADDKSVLTDANNIGVFIKQSDGGSVFRDVNLDSVFGDVVEQSVFKADGGGSVFRYQQVFHNSLTNPASASSVQLAVNADIAALAGIYTEISNAQIGYYYDGTDTVAYWSFWLV